jgi:hypothetical protein
MQNIEYVNYNKILNREILSNAIKRFLINFEANKHNLTLKRGLYIHGAPGSGKTQFVINLLNELNYDIIKYDAGDIRNKNVIDTITKNNMADKSVVSLLKQNSKQIAIIMDEIDGMNNGDKGGINSLIKIIRPKKTKKQKLEELSFSPIICISSYYVDKKIKELMKVCNVYELKSPTAEQMKTILQLSMPTMADTCTADACTADTDTDTCSENNHPLIRADILPNMVTYLQGDLRKLTAIQKIYKKNEGILKSEIIQNIFKPKAYNEDTKEITKNLFQTTYPIADHNNVMNDTDRTIVGLLWHENIIDVINKESKAVGLPLYAKILDQICFADYIDRITFQKQIWQFNEMSSLIKTFYCNKILHDTIKPSHTQQGEIRFTKVLTKYSTEYNNSLFIQELCQKLSLDKKDTFSFFIHLRENHTEEEMYTMFESYEITKLDINRIYRYLDKYTNRDCKIEAEMSIEEEEELITADAAECY